MLFLKSNYSSWFLYQTMTFNVKESWSIIWDFPWCDQFFPPLTIRYSSDTLCHRWYVHCCFFFLFDSFRYIRKLASFSPFLFFHVFLFSFFSIFSFFGASSSFPYLFSSFSSEYRWSRCSSPSVFCSNKFFTHWLSPAWNKGNNFLHIPWLIDSLYSSLKIKESTSHTSL